LLTEGTVRHVECQIINITLNRLYHTAFQLDSVSGFHESDGIRTGGNRGLGLAFVEVMADEVAHLAHRGLLKEPAYYLDPPTPIR